MTHILIIEARFYNDIADQLADAAIAELKKDKTITYERIVVPGCFEIPAAVAMAYSSARYDGYIALGCVIRGETSHYDYVCTESARGLNELATRHLLAIGYGIITCENQEQALTRADKKRKNVGGRAAKACLQMIEYNKKMATS